MVTNRIIDRITDTLRDSGLSWLLPDLRQDLVVWNALNDPDYFEKVIQSKPVGEAFLPVDFSPSRLALLALDPPGLPVDDPQNLIDSMDDQAIQLTMRSFNDQAHPQPAQQELASAGVIALILLNNFNTSKSWNGLLNTLRQDPRQYWMTPITCLFGFLDNPTGLLHALVQPAVLSLHQELAVHAILSNPLPALDQGTILLDLCWGYNGNPLPPSNRLLLLRALSEQRPQFASDLATKWLEARADSSNPPSPIRQTTVEQLDQLLELLFQVEIRHLSGKSDELQDLLDQQLSISHNLNMGLINHYILHEADHQIGKFFHTNLTETFDIAIKLATLNLSDHADPASQANLALTLAGQGCLDEANKLIPPPEEPSPTDVDVLFSIARVSYLSGDHPRSWGAASRILDLLNQNSLIPGPVVWGDGFSLVNLGQLLLDLRKPSEAVTVFERAVRICPNDACLLKLLAEAYKSSHVEQKAAEILNILVSLEPSNLDHHRSYAQSLEGLDDWEASLSERLFILESNRENSVSTSLQDSYDYAHCAIRANKPDLALKICTEILTHHPEDSQALIYSGEAYLMMGETDQGMDCLTQATLIAPHRPEAWLALADAQKKIYPLPTVIETLKNASQAVPESSQIRYALGDLYVQDNELTLALPELKSAVELSPDNPQFLQKYGGALKSLGHIEESQEMFSKAYRLEPDFPGLAQTYARILVDLGELEAAISPLETLINSKTVQEPAPYLDYARCVLTLNRQGSINHSPMKALIALNAVLQIDPNHAEAKALTAEALFANGEHELAFQAYREALDTSLTEDKDWFERLSFGFGCVAVSIGKHDIAIAALQEAGQANPNNPAIFKELSDAYISADLPEDAMKAARGVLVIDGENPDNLAWFANQVVKISCDKKPEIFNSIATMYKEVTDEALSALGKAIQLAPTRADLLVQLGNFQSIIGEHAEAQATFASIASLDFATVEDLVNAAKYLSEINDHSTAAACLEKAIAVNQTAGCKHDPSLYSSLAQEYVKNNDHSSAIVILDKAIELIPNDNSLISLKVEILLELGQLSEALRVIETSLQKSPTGRPDVDLLFLASKINRCMGDFSAAIKYVRMGTALSVKKGSRDHRSDLPFQHRTYLAEIYRALLQPEHAYQILHAEPIPNKSDFANEQDYLDFTFLNTELELETGERISPDIQDVKLEAFHPAFDRLMAINARLMNKAGNYKQAEQLFQLALNKTVKCEQTANPLDWLAPYTNYLQLISMIDTAQDLGLWDHAMTIAQQVAETACGEPLSGLNLARTMILKAEFNHLCELFEVIKHKPFIDTQPNETYMLCKQYLDHARSILEAYRGEVLISECEIIDDQISRWQARADFVYEQDNELTSQANEILTRLISPGDTAAVIDHLHRTTLNDTDSDALTQIIKLARPYPRNPSVILQVALALQDNNPQDAVKSLQSVLEHNPNFRNPSLAFCNILLARVRLNLGEYDLAQEAVEDAISFWPDESSWHRLAAQIDQHANHISDAICHLQAAAGLEPENLSCHLELGRLLFDYANDDAGMLNQALTSFENALALDKKNKSALIHLARVHYLLSDYEKAETYARSALLLVPDKADLYQLLSKIAHEREDFQDAYEYASKAIQINPIDTQSTVMLAKSLAAMGRHNEALAKLNAVIPLVQEAIPLHLERVNIVRKINGLQIALNELKALAATHPDDFNVLNALSKSFYEVGEVEDAVAIAQQALKNCTDKTSLNEQANLHLLMGQALRQSGQLEQSIQHLSDAIQLAPSCLDPYLELGLARKERREYEQALQIFERATLIAPNDPRAPFQAGLALKESKDYKSSEAMLRRAVSLAPNDLTIRRQLAAVVALNLIHNPRSARINAP